MWLPFFFTFPNLRLSLSFSTTNFFFLSKPTFSPPSQLVYSSIQTHAKILRNQPLLPFQTQDSFFPFLHNHSLIPFQIQVSLYPPSQPDPPHYINQPIVLINLVKNFPHLDLQKPKQPNPPICLIGDNYGIYTHWWVHIITVLTCGGQPVGGTRRKKREWDRERKKRKIVWGRERERERIDLTLEKRRIKK